MIDEDEGDDWDDDVDDEAASPRWAHDDEEDDEEEEKEEDEDEEKTEEPPSPSVVAQRLPIKLGSRLKVKFEGGTAAAWRVSYSQQTWPQRRAIRRVRPKRVLPWIYQRLLSKSS